MLRTSFTLLFHPLGTSYSGFVTAWCWSSDWSFTEKDISWLGAQSSSFNKYRAKLSLKTQRVPNPDPASAADISWLTRQGPHQNYPNVITSWSGVIAPNWSWCFPVFGTIFHDTSKISFRAHIYWVPVPVTQNLTPEDIIKIQEPLNPSNCSHYA
jgi:hypothetical protein